MEGQIGAASPGGWACRQKGLPNGAYEPLRPGRTGRRPL